MADKTAKIMNERKSNEQIEVVKLNQTKKSPRREITLLFLFVLLIVAFFISFSVGRYGIPLNQLFESFYTKIAGQQSASVVDTVIFKVRLPRITAAILVGAALSMSGASYQGLFRNPMVSGDILGASAGAGFGAVIAMLFSFSTIGIQVSAFVFGLVSVALTYLISTKIKGVLPKHPLFYYLTNPPRIVFTPNSR